MIVMESITKSIQDAFTKGPSLKVHAISTPDSRIIINSCHQRTKERKVLMAI